MSLDPQSNALLPIHRSWADEIDMRLADVQSRPPMPEVDCSPASELINLNHLIEDVASLLTALKLEDTVVDYDLAANLPLVEGDYRLVRRLFVNMVNDLNGVISLRSRFTQFDRGSLIDNFPGADLPEGSYVLIQVAEQGAESGAASRPGCGSICQFLFPCAAVEPMSARRAETVQPKHDRWERAGPNRVWLFMRGQRAGMELQSACFTTSHERP